jgi:hypothetical protein
MEYLEDISGADNMEPEWGERFRGWYFFKRPLRKETLSFNGVTYTVNVCDYHYQFIMPSKLEFSGGLISYSEAERQLGVFRFPRGEDGQFSAPVSMKSLVKDVMNLTSEEIKSLLSNRQVLTFEAFRVPQYGFEFFCVADRDFEDLASVAGQGFRGEYEALLEGKVNEVKTKITSSPNNLLILRNVLDFELKDLAEVAFMTGGIIHIN